MKAAFELQGSLLFGKHSNVHYHVYVKEGLYAILLRVKFHLDSSKLS